MGNSLFRADANPTRGDGMYMMASSNFGKRVWYPAAASAGLDAASNAHLGEKDPRRAGATPHDLRAMACSFLLDAGATKVQAQTLLRHASERTTTKYYARAFAVRQFDPDRAAVRLRNQGKLLDIQAMLDQLWDAWAAAYPLEVAHILNPVHACLLDSWRANNGPHKPLVYPKRKLTETPA